MNAVEILYDAQNSAAYKLIVHSKSYVIKNK